MKGDFSRSTFRREEHYNSVRMQQGRVLLDAESNEQADIQNYLRETTARDLIGRSGAPRDDDGFRIGLIQDDLLISAGRFYVDGILCECEGSRGEVLSFSGTPITNVVLKPGRYSFAAGQWVDVIGLDAASAPFSKFVQVGNFNPATATLTFAPLNNFSAVHFVHATIRYTNQPDAPKPDNVVNGKLPLDAYLVYLDVWQRHITALEDPKIRETALGGPDTTTRAKTIWQVRAKKLAAGEDCKTFNIPPTTGLMSARTVPPQAAANPCEIPRSAGYRRLENQLYRVEIHATTPNLTFKWSRENGSIVFPIELVANDKARLKTSRLDDRLWLHHHDYVELIDDAIELHHQPGKVVRVIDAPDAADPVVQFDAPINTAVDFTKNPRVRVWNATPPAHPVRGLSEGANMDGFVALEDGIEVKFSNGTYETGDYWLIPARTAISQETGSIEWPMSGPNPIPLPPHGIDHHYAALAKTGGANGAVEDCRPIFSPAITPELLYAGGDGQEVMPNVAQPNQLVKLPLPLRASVSAGAAIEGAIVQFELPAGKAGKLTATSGSGTTVTAKTDASGVATCTWEVNSQELSQTVIARLIALDTPGFVAAHPPIVYNAHLSVAANVSYQPGKCSYLNGVFTVQDALDKLCAKPTGGGVCSIVLSEGDDINARLAEVASETNLEICFKTGKFFSDDPIVIDKKNSVKVTGGGNGTVISVKSAIGFRFTNCNSVLVRDLSISGDTGDEGNDFPAGALSARGCDEVQLDTVRARCGDANADGAHAAIAIRSTRHVSIRRCEALAATDQIGIFLDSPQTADVEENRVHGPGPRPIRPDKLKQWFVQDVRVVTAGAGGGNFQVVIGNHNVAFNTSDRAAADLRKYFSALAKPANPTPQIAVKFVEDAMEAAIRNTSVRTTHKLADLDVLVAAAEAVEGRASSGIHVQGLKHETSPGVGSVTIRDNWVADVATGIRAGIGNKDVGQGDIVQHASVSGNDVRVTANEFTGDAEKNYGIVSGSCGTVHIFANTVESSSNINESTGIRLIGVFGALAILRDNSVTRFRRGLVAEISNTTTPRQWRMVSNVATTTIVPYEFGPMLNENNAS